MYKRYWFIPYSLYQLKQRKAALVKVSALALKELTSVPYYVRFFICNMGIVIAMSLCVVKVSIMINVMCSATVVKKSKVNSTP